MDDSDRLKAYGAMAETSRKWATVMDAKAAFISALTSATLAFLWTGARISDSHGAAYILGLFATAFLLISLLLTLNVVLPRVNLRHAFGKKLEYAPSHHPISYFGYVAANFPEEKHKQFIALLDGMDEKAIIREALEQHYTICHVVHVKANWVAYSGWCWLAGALLVGAALLIKA